MDNRRAGSDQTDYRHVPAVHRLVDLVSQSADPNGVSRPLIVEAARSGLVAGSQGDKQ